MKNLNETDFAHFSAEPNTLILDVRTKTEFDESHIEGALNIDFYRPDFENELKKLDKNVNYAVYCRSGHRSGLAVELMESLGFQSAANLKSGIIGWVEKKMKVVN